MNAPGIPLARCAGDILTSLASATGSKALASLDGPTLLGERAALNHLSIPGRASAGGGCMLYDARGGAVALNLARVEDRELLPALFEADELDASTDARAIVKWMACSDAMGLVSRGRSMGLAIAAERETPSFIAPRVELMRGGNAIAARRLAPRVIDLSALWAGPLASHLLWLAGAEVVKVESRSRPDAMREGESTFHALLNQGKASVVLDFADNNDRQALLALISTADIVIEAARPRALAQLGIDADDIVRRTPGLAWITITAHGAEGAAADWVGFGDDCAVAAGLSAALRDASGQTGFVGDALADPLTGIFAAQAAWETWASRCGARVGIAMSHVVAHCLAIERSRDSAALNQALLAWAAAAGQPFPSVARRSIGAVSAFGEHTNSYLAKLASC
jgi:hypothetical protein